MNPGEELIRATLGRPPPGPRRIRWHSELPTSKYEPHAGAKERAKRERKGLSAGRGRGREEPTGMGGT